MESILAEIQNGVAILTLNRPEKMNAFNGEMIVRLRNLLHDYANDQTVRAIYITGRGKAFSAGQDLVEITSDNAPGSDKILADYYNPLIVQMRSLEKPIVCVVNGVAAGAGANIALCGDIVLAGESASFIQAFSKIGLIPDSGGTYFLPRLVGFQKASALMMLGEKVSAKEAERIGMIYRVYADDALAAAAMKIAATLASMPTRALAYTKHALNASFGHTLDQQLALEATLQVAATNTSDYREGVTAFLEKRVPVFKGK